MMNIIKLLINIGTQLIRILIHIFIRILISLEYFSFFVYDVM